MFPERLKSLRLEAKLTQKEVADSINVSQPQYARWEAGNRKPSSETLEKFAQFYNVSTDYLLGKTDNKNEDEIDLSSVKILLRQTYEKMTDEELKIFEQEFRELLKKRKRIFEEDLNEEDLD